MSERKLWTPQEDAILKLLKHDRKVKKWATIARLMHSEFAIEGRTGKQCRERYHNHLDAAILNLEWTEKEQEALFKLHGEVGNRWAQIAQNLKGRSENQVKNFFYSRLRRAMRCLNKLINSHLTQHKAFKASTLSRIITAAQSKFKNDTVFDEVSCQLAGSIMKRLFLLDDKGDLPDADFAISAIEHIEKFEASCKKVGKLRPKARDYKYSTDITHLKPPPKTLRKVSASLSCASGKSDESSSSFLSFNSCFSCTNLGEFDVYDIIQPTAEDKSLRKTSNNSETSQSQHPQNLNQSTLQRLPQQSELLLKPGFFQRNDATLNDDQFYEGEDMREMDFDMMCDESPQIGRIIEPKEFSLPFYMLRKREEDNEDIQFKEELEKMEFE